MEDELVLDGAITSAAFDDALETVSRCDSYICPSVFSYNFIPIA